MKRWKLQVWDYAYGGWRTVSIHGDTLGGDQDPLLFDTKAEALAAAHPNRRAQAVETVPRPRS